MFLVAGARKTPLLRSASCSIFAILPVRSGILELPTRPPPEPACLARPGAGAGPGFDERPSRCESLLAMIAR